MFTEFTDDQRRQTIDARQLFEARRRAFMDRQHNCRGRMYWQESKGQDYLYHSVGSVRRSQGPRGPETEARYAEFTGNRERLDARVKNLDARLKSMAKVNKAVGIARVPGFAARILRRLDAAELLGRHLLVVGTHALYAYEAAAGGMFDPSITATNDLDLLFDVRRRLALALVDAHAEGVMGIIKSVDRSFTPVKELAFRAENDDGYMVDVIRPMQADEIRAANLKLADADVLEPAAIEGLDWLVNAPKFNQTVIDDAGRPLFVSTVDPRVFALHKLYISREFTRDPVKRPRDLAQARSVARLAVEHLGLDFGAHELTAVPREIVDEASGLLAA